MCVFNRPSHKWKREKWIRTLKYQTFIQWDGTINPWVTSGVGYMFKMKFWCDTYIFISPCSLMCCSLTTVGCQTLIAALSCSSVLKNLDLSYNHLEDQGVRLLSDWLQEPRCRLEVLRWDLSDLYVSFYIKTVGVLHVWVYIYQ